MIDGGGNVGQRQRRARAVPRRGLRRRQRAAAPARTTRPDPARHEVDSGPGRRRSAATLTAGPPLLRHGQRRARDGAALRVPARPAGRSDDPARAARAAGARRAARGPEPVTEHWEECASPVRFAVDALAASTGSRCARPTRTTTPTRRPAVYEWNVSAAPPGPDSTPPQHDDRRRPSDPTSAARRRSASARPTTAPPGRTCATSAGSTAARTRLHQPVDVRGSQRSATTRSRCGRVDVQGNRDGSPALTRGRSSPRRRHEPAGDDDRRPGPTRARSQTDATLAFSSDEEGATFECSLDSGDYADCSRRAVTGLAVGDHTVLVRAVDGAGNRDRDARRARWTIGAAAGRAHRLVRPARDRQHPRPQRPLAVRRRRPRRRRARDHVDLNGRTIDGGGSGAGIRNDGFDHVTINGGGP